MPAATGSPSALPRMPRPGTAANVAGRDRLDAALGGRIDDGARQPMLGMALQPGGPGEHLVLAAPSVSMPTRRDAPEVSVPVLSKASSRVRARASSAAGSRTRQPQRASRPMPSEVASGAARPTAQGQATTSTASPTSSARSNGSDCAQ